MNGAEHYDKAEGLIAAWHECMKMVKGQAEKQGHTNGLDLLLATAQSSLVAAQVHATLALVSAHAGDVRIKYRGASR